jgi:4-hydroxy-3-methylbut-2-enyl diphosphate reductase
MEGMRIEILRPNGEGKFDFRSIGPDDAVILPAFGVTVADFDKLRGIGCVVVDTTCGSVLNVWKRVQQYARDGFTAVVHGKYYHEETKATVSQVNKHNGGKYIIVRNMEEAEVVCGYIEEGGDAKSLLERFAKCVSRGFDPEKDLGKVGIANQTTMLSNESLDIAARFREAMITRYGSAKFPEHFRTFDTICSATQERQDAVIELIDEPLDAMLVIGGYNSSNTNHLASICSEKVRTFHIKDSTCIDPEAGTISHKKVATADDILLDKWPTDANTVGVTAGASTPNNKIGEAIERILALRGIPVPA